MGNENHLVKDSIHEKIARKILKAREIEREIEKKAVDQGSQREKIQKEKEKCKVYEAGIRNLAEKYFDIPGILFSLLDPEELLHIENKVLIRVMRFGRFRKYGNMFGAVGILLSGVIFVFSFVYISVPLLFLV